MTSPTPDPSTPVRVPTDPAEIVRMANRLAELEQSERQLLLYAQDLRRSHEEVRLQVRRLTQLHTVNLAIAAALTIPEVVQLVLDGLARLVTFDAAAMYVLSPSGTELTLADKRGELPPTYAPIVLRFSELEQFGETPNQIVLTLRSGHRVVGLLLLQRQATPFNRDDRTIIELVGAQAAVALHNARVFEETHTQAITDGLTGLYNQRYFSASLAAEIDRAHRLNYTVGLLMCDLDHFKTVNDTYGHRAGDELLRTVATTVRAGVRKTDLVARYGGDEMVIILPGCRRQSLRAVGEKVRASTERAVRRLAFEPPVTLSVGGAMFPQDADSANTLIQRADEALYVAKRNGGNQVCIADNLRK